MEGRTSMNGLAENVREVVGGLKSESGMLEMKRRVGEREAIARSVV